MADRVMEFPAEWAVFQADEFDTAAPSSHGKAVMELIIQARPNGRLLDHFRIATGGSEILEARFQLTDIISNAELEGVTAQFQFWGRDANLRRNMTTSEWLDVYGLIKSDELKLETAGGELIKAEKVLSILDMMTGARLKSAGRAPPWDWTARWSLNCRPCLYPWLWSTGSLHS